MAAKLLEKRFGIKDVRFTFGTFKISTPSHSQLTVSGRVCVQILNILKYTIVTLTHHV